MLGFMSTITRALWANAAFSTTTGLLCAIRPTTIAHQLGAVPAAEVSAVGLSLLGFAAVVAVVARRPSPAAVLAISAADLGWVIGTGPLLWLAWGALDGRGIALLLAVAAVVGALATAQLLGLIAHYRHPDPNGLHTHRLCLQMSSPASASTMWRALADLPAIARYASNLQESTLVGEGDSGLGATRRCVNTAGQAWTETCTAWEPGRAFTIRFDTTAKGFPFPVRAMIGGWTVEPTAQGSLVRAWWELTPNSKRWGAVFVIAMAVVMPRSIARLVSAMGGSASSRKQRQPWRHRVRAVGC